MRGGLMEGDLSRMRYPQVVVVSQARLIRTRCPASPLRLQALFQVRLMPY